MKTDSQLENEILNFLKNTLDSGYRVSRIAPLNGDASERRYFRIHTEIPSPRAKKKSFILMKSFNPGGELAPFLDIHRTLKILDIPVPEIFSSDLSSGFLLEEDCGDTTMETSVKGNIENRTESVYRKAVDILIKMQFPERKNSVPCIAYSRFFDKKKYLEELAFMVSHLIAGLLGTTVAGPDSIKISAGFRLVCGELSMEPLVFTHRDYHSRNIMALAGMDLKVLDFQDARMGPCQYDLVSLLQDSYSPLTSGLANSLVDYYLEKAAERGIHFHKKRFEKIFDYMTVQRSLKAAGTFAFQKVVKGNDSYIPFIKPALRTSLKVMERYCELLELKNCLFRYFKSML